MSYLQLLIIFDICFWAFTLPMHMAVFHFGQCSLKSRSNPKCTFRHDYSGPEYTVGLF